jgi:hypothetical protein
VRQLYRYDFLPLLVRHLLLAQLSRAGGKRANRGGWRY